MQQQQQEQQQPLVQQQTQQQQLQQQQLQPLQLPQHPHQAQQPLKQQVQQEKLQQQLNQQPLAQSNTGWICPPLLIRAAPALRQKDEGLVGFGGALHEEGVPPNQGDENAVAQEMPGGSRMATQPLVRELTTTMRMTIFTVT